MMCWENLDHSLEKDPYEETDDEEKKLVKEMQKPKDEEEHVNSTLHMGNQLKLSIEELSWETEDDGSTLDTQETEQQQSVYITNLEDDLQKNSTKLNEEEGSKDKKSAVKSRLFERPSLVNLSHVSKLYEESGSENKNIEENRKGENKKNAKESSYTDINGCKKGEQDELLKDEKPKKHHEIPRNGEKKEKSLVTKEMALSNLGKNIFIGDSAATSHMTSNKMGVYNLIPINGSVMIRNGQSISCTHKGKLDVICKHKDGSTTRETWDVKIVPQLNHDLFSFTKAILGRMADEWEIEGRRSDN